LRDDSEEEEEEEEEERVRGGKGRKVKEEDTGSLRG